jgi:hypothetical protein
MSQLAIPFFNETPDDAMLEIFRHLDAQGWRGIGSVCKRFQWLQGDDRFKEFWIISIGDKDTWAHCTLDLRAKTITVAEEIAEGAIALCPSYLGLPGILKAAMGYPAVPKGSFVAFPHGSRFTPSAILKIRTGEVREIIDIPYEHHGSETSILLADIKKSDEPYQHFNIVWGSDGSSTWSGKRVRLMHQEAIKVVLEDPPAQPRPKRKGKRCVIL